MFNFYNKVSIRFQKFPEGQGRGYPTWRAWVLIGKREHAFNYYPQPSMKEALDELMKFIGKDLDKYQYINGLYYKEQGEEEEHF